MPSSPKEVHSPVPPLPAVFLAILSVQGGAALAKGMFPLVGPAGTVSLRIILSACMLLLLFRPRLNRMSAAQWKAIVPYGIAMGAMNFSFYLALARIPLGLAVALEFTGPLAVAVLGSRRAPDFLWALLAATGIILLTPWSGTTNVNAAGALLALLAGACWGIYIVLGRRVSHLFSAGTGVATGMLCASLSILPVTIFSHTVAKLTPSLFLSGLGVAALSSALPYALELIALRAIPARTFGILMSVEPAVAALCGLLFLHERLNASQILAIGLVMAASAGTTLTAQRADAPVEV
jgi:inner membrane transporter RhtA